MSVSKAAGRAQDEAWAHAVGLVAEKQRVDAARASLVALPPTQKWNAKKIKKVMDMDSELLRRACSRGAALLQSARQSLQDYLVYGRDFWCVVSDLDVWNTAFIMGNSCIPQVSASAPKLVIESLWVTCSIVRDGGVGFAYENGGGSSQRGIHALTRIVVLAHAVFPIRSAVRVIVPLMHKIELVPSPPPPSSIVSSSAGQGVSFLAVESTPTWKAANQVWKHAKPNCIWTFGMPLNRETLKYSEEIESSTGRLSLVT